MTATGLNASPSIELVLDALEVVEPLDRAIEFRALFLGKLSFHGGYLVGEFGPIEILDRSCHVRQHREALVGHFREAAEHDDLLMRAARGHRQDPRPDRRHYRCVAGEHAEITLDAGDVNLVDLAGEGEFSGETRSKWKVAMGYLRVANGEWRMASGEWRR